jgi:hypothetical protein
MWMRVTGLLEFWLKPNGLESFKPVAKATGNEWAIGNEHPILFIAFC